MAVRSRDQPNAHPPVIEDGGRHQKERVSTPSGDLREEEAQQVMLHLPREGRDRAPEGVEGDMVGASGPGAVSPGPDLPGEERRLSHRGLAEQAD